MQGDIIKSLSVVKTHKGPASHAAAWRHRKFGVRWTCALLAASALLPSALIPVYAQDKPATSTTHASAILSDLQDAFAHIAEEMEPAVVTVFSTKAIKSPGDSGPFSRAMPRRSTGTGSGVIISSDGWILTNDHVAGGADKVTVRLHDGREFTGTVRRDYRSDLALVKIPANSLPTARLGDSDKIKIGHWAIAIGSPYRYEGSFSVGVVSSLNRRQEIMDFNSPTGGRFYPNMIQTDAAINPGNSGGPLCNINGEVIAINTAIESEGGGSVGIGFAIPVNSVKFVVKQLLEKGKVSYGYLGVNPTSVTPRLASSLRVERGALIESDPQADTPAGKAGLQAGDVVTGINGKPIHNELDLRTIVAQTLPGTAIELAVIRNGENRTLKTTLTEAPELALDSPHPQTKSRLGIEVQPLTDKLAEQARVPVKTAGVVVKSIDPNGSAADIDNLGEGVIILKVNDADTPNVQAFQTATTSLKSGDQVRLLLQMGKSKWVVFVTVD